MANSDDPFTQSPKTGTRQRPPLRIADHSSDPRAEITLGPDVHRVEDAISDALRHDPDLYQRAGQLVQMVRHDDPGDESLTLGTPIVRPVPLSVLTRHVSMRARCLQRKANGDYKQVPPPSARVQTVLESPDMWRGYRVLDGVVESPTMRPDGSILQAPGYDHATRTIYVPSCEYPAIPDEPTHGDAAIAYAHLADVFCDFPYIEPSHRSATVAAILTILARNAIRGPVPCWLFDAANKRSGKSLQVNVVTIVATGRPAATMTFPSEEEELEKILAGFALRGARVVNFDNVARRFGGAALDKCVTAIDRVQLRILGSNDMPDLPWRAVILASGNQVTAKGDMLPRILSPRIESPLENPEGRTVFQRPDRGGEDRMCAWALEHRAELVRDALTLLRAYVVAGRPEPAELPRWGGFGAWASLVAGALVWAGAPNPMGARRGLEADDDPTAMAERSLVLGWAELCRREGAASLTTSAALSHLYPPPKRDEPPDGYDDLRESIQVLTGAKPGYPPGTDRLGYALRKLKNRPLAGHRLSVDGTTGKSARWLAHPL